MIITKQLSLDDAQEFFAEAYDKHQEFVEDARKAQKQYEQGLTSHSKDDEMRMVYNFTKELIDAQVTIDIPLPMVTPQEKTPRNIARAKKITAMLRNEIDRMDTETLNDLIERGARIAGGHTVFTEWDKNITTHKTVGAVSFQEIPAEYFIPQPDITDIKNMDYCFIVRDVTKAFILKEYGKEYKEALEDETVDSDVSEDTDNDEIVTLVLMYYRFEDSWAHIAYVNDIELTNITDYYGRKDSVCIKCEKTQSGDVCECGSKHFEKRARKGETVQADFITNMDVTIKAKKPMHDDDGNFVQEEVITPVITDNGAMALVPTMQIKTEPNIIPYYKIKKLPVAIRRNGTFSGKMFGQSDCVSIKQLQEAANIATTKIAEKQIASGNIFTKPDTMTFDISNKIGKVLNIQSPDQLSMIKAIALEFNATSDFMIIQNTYQWAKGVLAVTDSYQGKPDTTATSGKAKEAQIAQSSGIQRAKSVLKNVFWQQFYENLFYLMLAFSDEKRNYNSQTDEGEDENVEFSKYDFLEIDEYNNLYYEDRFLFSIDETGVNPNNRSEMLENVTNDFASGLYGDRTNPETMLNVWKEKELLQYPGATRQVKFWQVKVQEYKQQIAQQQQLQQAQQQMELQQQALGGASVV